VFFDHRVYNCAYFNETDIWNKIRVAMGVIYGFIPNVVIIGTTILTMKYLAKGRKSAKRVSGYIPRQGTITAVLTTTVYCISSLPLTVYGMISSLIKKGSPSRIVFLRISYFLLILNVMSNFYIYTLTIKSFRRFLFLTLCSVNPTLRRSTSRFTVSTGNMRCVFFIFIRSLFPIA
jgi:hypothetical protein